jgi:hypothetical protein
MNQVMPLDAHFHHQLPLFTILHYLLQHQVHH